MRFLYKTFLTIALCTGISVSSFAQVNEEMSDFTNEIEAMRTVLQTERKILIMNEMTLTAEEAGKFWPIHDEYRAEVKKIGNLRVKVITDYAASYETMTDEVAKQLLDESIKFEEQLIKLKKKHVKKFRAILPDIKVTRYFQLENKLDAIIDYDLAAQIPLME
jgi:GTPase involved in cell partitioning and DNA repair